MPFSSIFHLYNAASGQRKPGKIHGKFKTIVTNQYKLIATALARDFRVILLTGVF